METAFFSMDTNKLIELIRKTVCSAVNEAMNSRKDKERIFNLKDASAYLNLSKQTIYSYTHKDKIPHSKKGKRLLFRKEDLDEWLKEGHSHKWKRTYYEDF